ncbi:hypothetical protein TIFTF001_037438 [Ficus carica]|uniref:Uncharacterized protein n=1 Tax=Ficus carica TaxID=3494 RepID=A0AA88E8R0_FICCA|nr:hypothetical protein TIFTF001_037438 [Ficus carica]
MADRRSVGDWEHSPESCELSESPPQSCYHDVLRSSSPATWVPQNTTSPAKQVATSCADGRRSWPLALL